MSDSFLGPYVGNHVPWLYVESAYWTCIGLIGNALFTSRVLIQWIISERRHHVVVPPIFWYLSFWGSVVSLLYAFHLDKLPIILSYLFIPFIYFRNLKMQKRDRENGNDAGPPS